MISGKAALAEFMAMTVFIFVGCATAVTYAGSPVWGVMVPLVFGLTITLLVYATLHTSGGQINPAATLALALAGYLPIGQAIVNIIAQITGSVAGAALLFCLLPGAQNSTLGSNELSAGVAIGNAVTGEIVMTFLLVIVVLETAFHPHSRAGVMAPLAIGFAVFVAHGALLPLDGCSINPARSFGVALLSGTWNHFWIFVVGPVVGAILAVPIHLALKTEWGILYRTAEENVQERGEYAERSGRLELKLSSSV